MLCERNLLCGCDYTPSGKEKKLGEIFSASMRYHTDLFEPKYASSGGSCNHSSGSCDQHPGSHHMQCYITPQVEKLREDL